MSKTENIKIYDANLCERGVMDRLEAHKTGAWHKTFHCWVVNSRTGSILFQLRSLEKRDYPGLYDISAAGHLRDDETVADGTREIAEELGIPLRFEDLIPMGYRIEAADVGENYRNREYQAVYMARVDWHDTDFHPQVEEVAGLMWMKISDTIALFDNRVKEADVQGIVYNAGLKVWEQQRRTVTAADFIPRIQNYYLTAAIMGERILENKLPLSIS